MMKENLQLLEIGEWYKSNFRITEDLADMRNYQSSGTAMLDDNNNIIGLNLAGLNNSQLFPIHLLPNLQFLNLTNTLDDDLSHVKNLINLTHLTHLFAAGNGISDIEPLRKLINLRELDLSNNNIGDITPIETLTKLTFLDLTTNNINGYAALTYLEGLEELYLNSIETEDAHFLGGLKTLKKLKITRSELRNCNTLKGLKNLTHLEFGANYLNNIDGLRLLSKLEYLDLNNNRFIEDASALSNLISLRSLHLGGNSIGNADFLLKLIKLEKLEFYGNRISEIEYLEELTALKYLDLTGNRIIELPYLGALEQLQFLYLGMNEITDISCICDNIQLENLHLTGNLIFNMYNISSLKNLKSLRLDECGVTDINFLRELKKLTHLDLSGNIASGFNIISELDALKSLRLDSCGISNLYFLKGLLSIESLYLKDNYIREANALSGLVQLKELNLKQNELLEAAFLRGLKKIEILNLSSNRLESFDIGNLPKLRNLDVSENTLRELILTKTHNFLLFFNASQNQIEDISFLKYVKNAYNILLDGNYISSLKVFNVFKQIKEININNNTVEDIEEFSFILKHRNLKIVANNNPCFSKYHLVLPEKDDHYNAIANELMKLEDVQVKASLPEKVVLLGNHGSGKSSLLYYLQNKKAGYKDDTTHILKIENYPKKFDKLPKAIIYDFGGQDFYHGIYKAFLTLDALTILLWRAATNFCHLGADSKQRPNRNFDVKYWMGQKKYSQMDGEVLLVKTHYDEDISYQRESYLNDYPDIEEEFFVTLNCVNDNVFSTKLNKAALLHLREKFEELLDRRKVGRDRGNTMSKPYYNFLLHILKAADTHQPVTMEELRAHYTVREQWRFIEDVYQLHLQGMILHHNENVWLKPVALTRYVHDEILNKEHLGNGIIEKSVFDKKNFTSGIIDLLVDQKVIFLHEYGLTNEMKPRQEYIIPNYLPLHDEKKSWFGLISFGQERVLFTLKFKDFLPFGLINQLICHFGRLPDNKMFWRDLLIFTIDSKVKIMIKLDFDTLEIKVHAHFKDDANSDFKNSIEKYLFYCIMAMYWDFTILPENIEQFNHMYRQVRQEEGIEETESENVDAYSYVLDFYKEEACRPFDLYISKDGLRYINYRALCNIVPGQIKIQSFMISPEKDLENPIEISAHIYQNFTHKNLKAMKKIFISYSRKDKRFKDELKTQLKLIERYSVAKAWSCEEMRAGEWDEQIQNELKESDIIIYMVSDNFLASDYIMDKEVNEGIDLVKDNPDKRIICVLVRECSWDSWQFLAENFSRDGQTETHLGKYQFLPWHTFNVKRDNEREELISLEQWGREGFEVRSLAYKQITNKVLETIKLIS